MQSHPWVVSWFDRCSGEFAGETTLWDLDDAAAARILALPFAELLSGEFALETGRAKRLRAATGYTCDLDKFDYFLGAAATD